MSISLASIRKDAVVKAPRIILLGREKIGKSSFATGCRFENGLLVESGLNEPIVLPIKGEEGVDDIAVAKFPTLNSFSEVKEALGVLAQDSHEYKTVVIDSISSLEPIVFDHVCTGGAKKFNSIEEVGGGYGKGYTEALLHWRTILNCLDYLRNNKGMASILIGHVKVKRFDDPNGESYDQYQSTVNDKAASLLYQWSDQIMFANTKTAVKTEEVGFGGEKKRGIDISGGQRFLFTQQRPAHPGGGRGVFGQLPHELPLSWTAYQTAVQEAIKRQSGQ